MYSDPGLVRNHVVKLSLNEREAELINAFCAFTGEQKASLLREMILKQVVEALHGGLNFAAAGAAMPRTNHGHLMA